MRDLKFYFKGFSLVELLVSLVILSIVLGFIFSILHSGKTTWETADTVIEVQQQARQALDFMVKELRQSSDSVISGVPDDGSNYTSVSFSIPTQWNDTAGQIDWSPTIEYSLVNNQIFRNASDGQPPYLANHINSLIFRRQATNVIEVFIEALKNERGFSLNSQVTLRN